MQKLKNNDARPKFTGSYKVHECNSLSEITVYLCLKLIHTFVLESEHKKQADRQTETERDRDRERERERELSEVVLLVLLPVF